MSRRHVLANPAPKIAPAHPDYPGELLRPEAVFGVIAFAVQPWFVALRAGEFARCLALTHIEDRHFATLNLFGSHYEIGTCAVTGLCLTLTQMICASMLLTNSAEDTKRRILKLLSVSGWVLATGLELFLSFCLCRHSPRTGDGLCAGPDAHAAGNRGRHSHHRLPDRARRAQHRLGHPRCIQS